MFEPEEISFGPCRTSSLYHFFVQTLCSRLHDPFCDSRQTSAPCLNGALLYSYHPPNVGRGSDGKGKNKTYPPLLFLNVILQELIAKFSHSQQLVLKTEFSSVVLFCH